MNNSSLLSNSTSNQNKSKKCNDTSLPPISTSLPLKYSNDYQNYEEQLNNFKTNNIQLNASSQIKPQQNNVSQNVSSVSSIISSSSSSSISKFNKSSAKSPAIVQQKIYAYQDSPNFWKAKQQKIQKDSYSKIQKKQLAENDERQQYKSKSTEQIQKQVKQMRKQIFQMNQQLNAMLNGYNMAKASFTPKQMIKESNHQFYAIQVETNKKIEEIQVNELKKLSSVQLMIKDKDILLDLEQLTGQLQKTLHSALKQEHDARLKIHKQDLKLDDIIRVNQDNQTNNKVKLLKLQIIYYMKKMNNLKIRQEQLGHQQKLIQQNDKNLDLKIQSQKKANNNFALMFNDQKYERNKQNWQQLKVKINSIQKNIQTIRKAQEIKQEKLVRQILEMDQLLKNKIKNRLIFCEEEVKQIDGKIMRLIEAYKLSSSSINGISYKFIKDEKVERSITTLNFDTLDNKKEFSLQSQTSKLKPNFRSINSSKLQKPRERFLSSRLNLQKVKHEKATKSNQKLNQRYNDKNLATIDVPMIENNEFLKIEIEKKLKPKNFRLLSKQQKDQKQMLQKDGKNKSFSMNIQNTKQYVEKKLLKPQLLMGAQMKLSNTNSNAKNLIQFNSL